jgi:hypothetical protein
VKIQGDPREVQIVPGWEIQGRYKEIPEIYSEVWNSGVKGDTGRFVTNTRKSDRDAGRFAGDTGGSGEGTKRF